MKLFLTFLGMISCTVIANLLMKTGTMENNGTFIQKLMDWKVLLGLMFFGTAALTYVVILGQIPLNVAQSFGAAQFIAVILASAVILREPISLHQWAGITLIAIGICVVGWARS